MDFIQEINKVGQMYLVGGAVRDRLFYEIHKLGKDPKDFDLMASKIKETELMHILEKHGKVKEVGKQFGIITFKPTDKRIMREIEIALPRTEESTGAGYRDFIIKSDPFIPIEEDLSRRDATINSIAVSINNVNDLYRNISLDEIIDPFNGVKDIKELIWRAVGDPRKRFLEDPTRMMRCIRQASVFGLRVEKDTLNAIIYNADLLKVVADSSPVRITEELVRGIQGKYFINWIEFILSNRIGEILGLKYTGKVIKNVKTRMEYAYAKKMSHVIIMFLILQPLGSHVDKWTKLFELSAAQHFDKNDTYLLKKINKYYRNLLLIDFIQDSDKKELEMRKWIQKTNDTEKDIEYEQNITDFVFDAIEAINHEENKELKDLYIKLQPQVLIKMKNLKCSGFSLQKEFEVKGKSIGLIKEYIFEKVVSGEMDNDEYIIMDYLHASKAELFPLLGIIPLKCENKSL